MMSGNAYNATDSEKSGFVALTKELLLCYNESMVFNKKEYDKEWRRTHKLEIAIYSKKYHKHYNETHREERNAYKKTYNKLHKEKNAIRWKTYYNSHKKEQFARQRKSYQTNIKSRLPSILRTRLSIAVRRGIKSGSAVRDLGCSLSEFRFYLEGKFTDGMTWENYGHIGWHIDHVIPLAFFDLTDREQLLRACHYTNLQPLWAQDNLVKGKRILV